MDFQGLPISIENKKGSHRKWYDVGEQKAGVTVMKFPYGYIKGTLGTDGDEVDVYIGKDKDSEKVFIITQNKAPDFVKIDEQKVMLGFNSTEQARLAYLAHMDKPKALRNIKEMHIDEFKTKLDSHKGKLIKGALITYTDSDKIGGIVTSFNQRKKDILMTTASEDLQEVEKALSARIVSSIARRSRMEASAAQYAQDQRVFNVVPVPDVPQSAGIAETQPQIGTNRTQTPGETPVIPVRVIHNDVNPTQGTPEIYKSCVSCGRMNKSLEACLSCDNRPSSEATPIWKR